MRQESVRPSLLWGTVSRFICALLFLIAYFAAYIMFTKSAALADQYSEITKVLAMLLSGAFSYVPFAVAEVLLYALLAVLAVYLLVMLIRTILYPGKVARILRVVSNLSFAGALLLLLFMLLFGSNYFCTPLADKMDLTVRPRTVEDLRTTTETLLAHANEYAATVPRDGEGFCDFGSVESMARRLANGYQNLSNTYLFLKGTYAPAKPVYSWYLMSSFGIAGMYVPYTAESLVNPDIPEPAILFNMAHEMAHRLGIAPEDEANFTAFLACRASDDRYVKYAGFYMAYRYCLNALYEADPETALAVGQNVSAKLETDLVQLDEQIRKYEGPVQDTGEKINDTYLKSFSQTQGVQSYGNMVDLLIAYYENGDPDAS